jgi:hypothetical protein
VAVTAKQLREERAKLIADARKILDTAEAEKRDLSGPEREQWAKIMGGVDADGKRVQGEEEKHKERIDRLERQEAADQQLTQLRGSDRTPGKDTPPGHNEPTGPTAEQRALALQAWAISPYAGRAYADGSRTIGDLTQQQKDACQACGLSPYSQEIVFRRGLYQGNCRQNRAELNALARGEGPREQRAGSSAAQSITVGSSGGYLIPEGFVNNLEIALLQYGQVRPVADVMRTTSGNDLPWPTVNDTTVKGAILAENNQVSASDMSFGVIVFHA